MNHPSQRHKRDDFWSDAEDSALRDWWKLGYSASQISRALQTYFHTIRSRSSVIGRAHRLKLARRKGYKWRLTRSAA